MNERAKSGTARNGLNVDRALAEAKALYARRNPCSAKLHTEAVRVMPGGNTRSVLFYEPFPLVMARGDGCQLWDVDDNLYVDFLGEYSAGLYGHSHPVIRAAIHQALSGGINLGAQNSVEAKLAFALRERFPSMELLRFTNSGTEANLMALMVARFATGRPTVLAFAGAYHGAVLSFPSQAGSAANLPIPFIVGTYNDTGSATALIRRHASDLAAVIVEPMLGAGGCIPADAGFLRSLRSETKRAGTLLVFDEVMTSRLHPGGLQQAFGIAPDLTTLGKYLGGGMSFGAFGGRASIMEHLDSRRTDSMQHAGTFNNNVLSMHAGLAGLTKVFSPEAVVSLNRVGDELRERLNHICLAQDVALQFTGRGSLMTAHFCSGTVSSPLDAATGDQKLRELLFFHLLSLGIYAARRAMFTLSLPLTSADRQALVDAVADFIQRYESVVPPRVRAPDRASGASGSHIERCVAIDRHG